MPTTSAKFSLNVAAAAALLFYAIINVSAAFHANDFLQDPDTFWHIRTGQWILQHVQFPTVDVFSYTAIGRPWISTEWLSEVIFALAYNFGGWTFVSDLAAVSCAISVGIVCFYLLRHMRLSVALGWTAVTAVAIKPHFLARPHIFSYIILIIWTIELLDAWERDNLAARTFVLAPLMAVWANIHGSFTFGLALLAVFVAFSIYENYVRRDYAKCRRLVLVGLIVSACGLLTPYGISSALMTEELLKLKYTIPQIVELQAPDFQNLPIHLFLLIALLTAIAGFGVRLRGPRLVVFVMILFVGLSYQRGLVMLFMLAPIILARPFAVSARFLAPQVREAATTPDPVLQFLQKRPVAVPAVCLGLAALATVVPWWRGDIAPPRSIAPAAAIDFVRRNNITGNVFNDYNFGGFLLFSNIPTFVDGRALPFGDEFLHQYFEAILDSTKAFRLLDDYKISWVILLPSRPLVAAMVRSPAWEKVYTDDTSVVFVRRQKI
jgi:hypothetical protein